MSSFCPNILGISKVKLAIFLLHHIAYKMSVQSHRATNEMELSFVDSANSKHTLMILCLEIQRPRGIEKRK